VNLVFKKNIRQVAKNVAKSNPQTRSPYIMTWKNSQVNISFSFSFLLKFLKTKHMR